MVMPKILIVHNPNLNLLGPREAQRDGSDTLAAIDPRLADPATRAGALPTAPRKAAKRLASSSIRRLSRIRDSAARAP